MSSKGAERKLSSTAYFASVAAIIILASLLFLLAPILTPFVLAGIFAYLCNPVLERLMRLKQRIPRFPRTLAVLLVMLGLALTILLLLLLMVPLVQEQSGRLIARLPAYAQILHERLSPWLGAQLGASLQFNVQDLTLWLKDNQAGAGQIAGQLLASLKIGGMALMGLLANLLIVPVVLFYLLRDWPALRDRLQGLIPRPWLSQSDKLMADMDAVLAEFLRGQLSVMLLLALYYSLGLELIGLEFAWAVGVLTGMLIFLPYIGFGMGLILAVLVAALQPDNSSLVLMVLALYGVGQVVESMVLTPYLVGERIGLHPIAVLFALMAFAQVFGFFGVLLALPVSAAILVALRTLRTHYLKSSLYRGES